MFSQTILLSVLVALAEARFGQEQVPVAAIQAVTSGCQPGQAAMLAGQSISFLLAAANPCDDSINAAKGLVAAEQNVNPFVADKPSICKDPTLPITEALRRIVPLIVPAFAGSDVENANSNSSKATPFPSTGMSVADIMAANGFSNLTAVDSTGAFASASGRAVASTGTASSGSAVGNAGVSAGVSPSASAVDCGATTMITVTAFSVAALTGASTSNSTTSSSSNSNNSTSSAGTNASGVQQSTITGLDFGLCIPTMKSEPGLDGRSDTEFTFQAIDPLVNKGQEEALNPNIITNRICNQLNNVCEANDAAKSACQDAKTKISALGTKDESTANAWNEALGFAGTNLNPDTAPQPGFVGHD